MSLDYILMVNTFFMLSIGFLSSRFIFFIIKSPKEIFTTAKGARTEILSLLEHFIPHVLTVSKTLVLAGFSLSSIQTLPFQN